MNFCGIRLGTLLRGSCVPHSRSHVSWGHASLQEGHRTCDNGPRVTLLLECRKMRGRWKKRRNSNGDPTITKSSTLGFWGLTDALTMVSTFINDQNSSKHKPLFRNAVKARMSTGGEIHHQIVVTSCTISLCISHIIYINFK